MSSPPIFLHLSTLILVNVVLLLGALIKLQNSLKNPNHVLLDVTLPIFHKVIQNHWKLHRLWTRLPRDYNLLIIFMQYLWLWTHANMLTRYRVSAVSNLGIESGRYTRPVTPVASRFCKYCSSNCIVDERHAILECNTFFCKEKLLLW